jgi:hypothetical protein
MYLNVCRKPIAANPGLSTAYDKRRNKKCLIPGNVDIYSISFCLVL